MSGIKYPNIRRDESNFNTYHGQKILDPYFWLEDPDSDETKKFVEDQNAITTEYLNDCEVKSKFYDRYVTVLSFVLQLNQLRSNNLFTRLV